MDKQHKKITLYCTEGTADKTYTLWVEEKDGLYTVQALGGRRGGPQTPYTKGKPGSLPVAEKTYASVLKEKLGKGYHEGEDAPAYTAGTGKKDGGLRPMLLTADTEENLERYINDDAWGVQEKFNGHHVMIRAGGKVVQAYNKKGLERPIPVALEKSFLDCTCELDAELVGDALYVFDDMAAGTACLGRIQGLVPYIWSIKNKDIHPAPLVTGKEAKRAFVNALINGKKEGVVFKLLAAKYTPGKIDNLGKTVAVKVKFYKEMDCVVLSWTDKSSIEVGAYEGKKLLEIGKVTVPEKYVSQIEEGAVVRVRYLYGTRPGRKLYQPNLDPDDAGNVTRYDVAPKECKIEAMQFEGKDEENS